MRKVFSLILLMFAVTSCQEPAAPKASGGSKWELSEGIRRAE